MNKQELPLFKTLFEEHFRSLTSFAIKYVSDRDEAKGIVHDAFVKLWERHSTLDPDTNYKSYLFTSVRNKCLNRIRDKKKLVPLDGVVKESDSNTSRMVDIAELEREIAFALNTLPNKCRKVFELSRVEELKYTEIAERMNISVKTVEAQMTKALKLMREHLAEFLTVLIILLFK